MTPKSKTRITFDFDGDRLGTYEKLAEIICSSHRGSGIDIYGFINDSHRRLFDFVIQGVIVIDECEYELSEPCADSETARLIKSLLGKRSNHSVLREMAVLFDGEPFEASAHYRNTLYFPGLKAFMRADGMKPEDIAERLALDGCDKIILFPYSLPDGKSAYYELSLSVAKESFADYMRRIEEQRQNELSEAILQAHERSKAGYRAALRREKKPDWKTVEQITYRAFLNAEYADGAEALLAQKLRSRPAFVPELDYVAELDGDVIGNIMYTRSKIVNDIGGEWETLTFGPVSVLPKYQRDGVGSRLIRDTLAIARDMGFCAVLIFGHESYYPRFGFKPASEFRITTDDGKNFPAFMALPLYDGALDGVHGRLIFDGVYTALDKAESEKLNAKLAEPMDIDEYIDAQPLHRQQILRKVRGLIRAAATSAVERISYQMPTFWDRRNIIHFAAQRNHLGVYPGAEAMEHFAPRLWRYKHSKGAIQFPFQDFGDEQAALISEIAAWCAEHNIR